MSYLPSYSDTLYADIQPSYTDCLYHHGIKGQKWGVRRFQNTYGSLTSAGKARAKKSGRANTKKRINSNAVATALLLGASVAPLALVAYESYATDVHEFDSYANALTGSTMKITIDSTKDRTTDYQRLRAYFDIAYTGDGASREETRPFFDTVRLERMAATRSLSEAKRAVSRMESKPGLLRSKKRQDALNRAKSNVDELEKATSDFLRSADGLEQSMKSANRKYYDSDFGSRRTRDANGSSGTKSSNASNNARSSSYTDGDRRSTRYGRKSTAQTKSKDRVADMKSRGVKVGTVEEESKRVRDLSSRIQQAQREGKDTTQMVQDLQDARARKKIAVERESMQHGFVCLCRRSRAIL